LAVVAVDAKINIEKWNLLKQVQIHPLNLGTHDKPQMEKLNIDLDPSIVEELLKQYKND
jgi:hypothetical protein